MANRTVTDSAGRIWTCTAAVVSAEAAAAPQGRDVMLSCGTSSVQQAVNVAVGWQWESMSSNGLARLINQVSPAPRT